MPQVDPVILQLKADVADYQRDVTRAQKLSEEKLTKIGNAGTATGVALRKGFDLAKGAALGFGAGIGIESIVSAIKTGLDYASSLKEVSQQLGVTTDALQEYRYAGSQSGLSTQETDSALRQLTKSLGEAAAGTKTQAQAFDALKVSIKDTEGNVIDAGRALPLIAEALKGIETPAERSRLLIDLFGESAQKLEPLLAGGAGAIDELRDAAHRLGLVLSEDQIQRADETADKLAAVKQVLEARIASAVADNAGAILALAAAFERLATAALGAVSAYQKAKFMQGLGESKLNAFAYGLSPLPSDQAKAAGFRREAVQFRAAIGNIGAKSPGKRTLGPGFKSFDLSSDAKAEAAALAPFSPAYNPKTPGGRGGGRSTRVRTGPSAEEIAAKQAGEINRLQQEEIRARIRVTDGADERADLERELLSLEFSQRKASIESDKDLSAKQKAAQLEILDSLFGARDATVDGEQIVIGANKSLLAQAIEQDRLADLKREAADRERDLQDLADEMYRGTQDALRLQYDLADTQDERHRLALDILDAEDAYLKSKLDAVIASEAATEAEKERARIALAALDAQAGARRETVERQFEGPLARYGRDAKDSQARVEEAAARRIADLNDTIADTMTKALGIKDPFLRSLLQIFLDQNLFGPIAQALSQQGGGGGLFGLLGSLVGAVARTKTGGGLGAGTIYGAGTILPSTFRGRASGGHVNAGTMYRVNEGASPGRVEAFVPQGAGDIIPLGRMSAAQGGGGQGTVKIIIEEAEGFASRVRTEATGVAIEVQRAAAPAIVKASVAETFRQGGRPRL